MFPLAYDLILAPWERLGLRRWRADVVASATGHVLEIGSGTGRNLPYYRQANCIVLTDPDPAMLARARQRMACAPCPVQLVAADAQRLPFDTSRFDTVVSTLTFCTIPQPDRAFDEVRRVLKPGGTLRFFEHVRTPRHWVARFQDAATPVWRCLARGCHLNRQTLETAQAHGFVLDNVRYGLDGWLLAAELHTPVHEKQVLGGAAR